MWKSPFLFSTIGQSLPKSLIHKRRQLEVWEGDTDKDPD